MRIAVISDTHDRVPAGLLQQLAAADEIWHLGDVCDPETLAEFEALGKPLHVVLGNNEWHDLWPMEIRLERAGHRFHLIHIAPTRAPAGAEHVLHGHTHVPRDETDAGGVRWLNPGCITRPRGGSVAGFAWLTLREGRPPEWQRVALAP
jgi:putative phosphoesterase